MENKEGINEMGRIAIRTLIEGGRWRRTLTLEIVEGPT